jgi:hypothetical protein
MGPRLVGRVRRYFCSPRSDRGRGTRSSQTQVKGLDSCGGGRSGCSSIWAAYSVGGSVGAGGRAGRTADPPLLSARAVRKGTSMRSDGRGAARPWVA